MEPSDLARDTAVSRLTVAPGWYTAEQSNAWDFRTPSGGALMTVAMRAMVQELNDSALRPLSAHTHFCSPVPAGPLEVRVEVLRHGRAAAQMRAQLSSTSMPGPGLEDTTSQWLLTAVHARRARAGYATADGEIWDDRGRLVALATQTMLLRRTAGAQPIQE